MMMDELSTSTAQLLQSLHFYSAIVFFTELFDYQCQQWKAKIDTNCESREIRKKNLSLISLQFCLGRILMDVSNFMAIKINLKTRDERGRGFAQVSFWSALTCLSNFFTFVLPIVQDNFLHNRKEKKFNFMKKNYIPLSFRPLEKKRIPNWILFLHICSSSSDVMRNRLASQWTFRNSTDESLPIAFE